jgi:uncharacterized protein with HEPN domain
MSKRDNAFYLRTLYDAIQRVEDYTRGIDKEKFLTEHLIQDGVIRQLEIIGEAASHVDLTIQEKYPMIPWKDIVGMRNRLIHEYFGVDLIGVWTTVLQDLPPLKTNLTTILQTLPDQLGLGK